MPSPRAVIEVDGTKVIWDDLINIKVENTLYTAADSFECTLNNSGNLSDWFKKNQEVKVYIGYMKEDALGRRANGDIWNKNELKHIFTGKVDGIKPSFNSSKTVQLLGRDYSAPMIDTECTAAFKNASSGKIASIFAEKYGLKPIIASTSEVINTEMISRKKEWEVLQMLADLEGYVCYVTKNKELYFGPRSTGDDIVSDTLYYNYVEKDVKANCVIEFDDSTIGVINTVTVKNWNRKSSNIVKASAKNDFLIKAMGQVKERVFYNPKVKSVGQAAAQAKKLLDEYSRSVITASGTRMPGNPELFAECKVQVFGCSRFDGLYYMDKVTHSLDKSAGYINEFQITNLRPENSQQYRQDLY